MADLKGEVERLERERDAARAAVGESDADAALVNERERANGLERLLADRDRGERELHQRMAELERQVRVAGARATSLESELANLDDDIRIKRSASIVAVDGAGDPTGSRGRPPARSSASPGDRDQFAARLERANKAIQQVEDPDA